MGAVNFYFLLPSFFPQYRIEKDWSVSYVHRPPFVFFFSILVRRRELIVRSLDLEGRKKGRMDGRKEGKKEGRNKGKEGRTLTESLFGGRGAEGEAVPAGDPGGIQDDLTEPPR
jgi:hypothetical protein